MLQLDFIAEFPEPPALNSSAYNIQLSTVSAYGGNDSSLRSAGQVQISDNSFAFVNSTHQTLRCSEKYFAMISKLFTRSKLLSLYIRSKYCRRAFLDGNAANERCAFCPIVLETFYLSHMLCCL